MRLALIGAGRIGRIHGRFAGAQPEVDELIVYDVDGARAREQAQVMGGVVAETVDAALGASDAVIVAASTHVHASLVRAAIDRGLPVFCEKPLASSLAETIDLVRHIEAIGALVQVGFQRRFDPGYVAARRSVSSGDLGSVYLVRLIAHDQHPPPDDYIPVSGGIFRDSSIHDFDSLRWVTGVEVEEVYAAGSVRGFPIFAEHGDVDTAAAILRLTDGTLGVLSQTRHNPLGYDVRMEIVGSRDCVAVGLSRRTPLRSLEIDAPLMPGPPWDHFVSRFEVAYQAELSEFMRLARREISSPCSAQDALQAVRISEAASQSRREGRPVRLTDVPA